jgi:hypothetical protein
MKTSAEVFLVTLAVTFVISGKLSGSTVGLTLPGSGVVLGPVTNICKAALNCPALASDFQSGFSTPAQASFNDSWIGTNASENLTATGSASVGVLKDSSTVTVTLGNYPITNIYGDAASFVEDTITISDPSLTGTTGSLVLGMTVDGTGSDPTNSANGIGTNAGFSVFAGTSQEGFPPASFFEVTGGSISTSYAGPAIPFIYGQPFGIELYFEAVAGAFCENLTACSPWTGLPVSAIADGSDTAILDSLTVYDSDGNIVPAADWSVTSSSGAIYTANGVVPEPSYLLILATLCIGLAIKRV